jgi:pilus assembly protein CpaB
VRVTRGKDTTDTPVSAKAASGAMLSGQSEGLRRTGQVLPSAHATLIK